MSMFGKTKGTELEKQIAQLATGEAVGGAMYYAFYAPEWKGKAIELRGLEPGRNYTVTEYTADEPRSYEVSGDAPVIRPEFKGNYLIEVK